VDIVSVLASLPAAVQAGLLTGLQGILLFSLWSERREHRAEITATNTRLAAKEKRIQELERSYLARIKELEREIDAERDKRRIAEDAAAMAQRAARVAQSRRRAVTGEEET
jgi:uncharacterized protein YlxW (UPF0749 family)